MARLVGKPRDSATEQAVTNSRYVASLYVARKKVWEGRAASYEEASQMAKAEKEHKYHGTKSTIVVRESAD
jgi:hypothetical protein